MSTPIEDAQSLLKSAVDAEAERWNLVERLGFGYAGRVSVTVEAVQELDFNLKLQTAKSLTLQSITLAHIAQTLARIEEHLTKPYPDKRGDPIPPEVIAGFSKI